MPCSGANSLTESNETQLLAGVLSKCFCNLLWANCHSSGSSLQPEGTELLEEAKAQRGTAAGTLLLLELEITNWYKQEKSSHHLTAEGTL